MDDEAVNCGYFTAGLCRSCSWLAKPYPEQVAAKDARVREVLAPFVVDAGDGIVGATGTETADGSVTDVIEWMPPVGSAPTGFRTKVKLVVSGTVDNPVLGILDAEQRGIDLRECPIVAPTITRALPSLAAFIDRAGLTPYDVRHRRGELKNLIITVSPAGELMVRFVLRSTEAVLRIRKHLGWLQEQLPTLRVVSVNLLPAHAAVLEGEEEIVLSEEQILPLRLPGGEVTLHLGSRSFVQTNTEVAVALYVEAREWVNPLNPRSIWDLYCGIGGFALHLALPKKNLPGDTGATRHSGDSRTVGTRAANSGGGDNREPDAGDVTTRQEHETPETDSTETVRKIVGVELSKDAVEGARLAAAEAGLDASFIAQDATEWARQQLAVPGLTAPDLVVVNPPRRGIGPELARLLNDSDIRHVLYSSCSPDSLARDLANMPRYHLRKVRLFDMFPHTRHAEVLVLLSRPQSR